MVEPEEYDGIKNRPYLKVLDPKFLKALNRVLYLWDNPEALDPKTQLLIRIVLDTLNGRSEMVYQTAIMARALGATDQELSEVLRMIYHTNGLSVMVNGLSALKRDEVYEKEFLRSHEEALRKWRASYSKQKKNKAATM